MMKVMKVVAVSQVQIGGGLCAAVVLKAIMMLMAPAQQTDRRPLGVDRHACRCGEAAWCWQTTSCTNRKQDDGTACMPSSWVLVLGWPGSSWLDMRTECGSLVRAPNNIHLH